MHRYMCIAWAQNSPVRAAKKSERCHASAGCSMARERPHSPTVPKSALSTAWHATPAAAAARATLTTKPARTSEDVMLNALRA